MSEPTWEEIVERSAEAEQDPMVCFGGAENYQYVITRLVREVDELKGLLDRPRAVGPGETRL